MIGTKLPTLYSNARTSSAKITPASGVLNEAAMPAAVPQAAMFRILLFGNVRIWPMRLPLAAPR
jgi:hypothetical protein